MSGLRTLLVVALAGLAAVPACKSEDETLPIPAADTKATAKFDRNNILDLATLTDVESIDVTLVQRFFAVAPYGQPSFLETYQSNGIRAADAVVAAARNYRINPIVFLAFAEAAQSLIASRTYPFPPQRVEYVFGCGCVAQNNCLPSYAGFDRQVDCLGQQLRSSIDTIRNSETSRTSSGWGTNVPMTTLDNLKVTPENEATAALYDRTPRVNEGGRDGTWLFWSVLDLYKEKLGYSGPVGNVDGRWIGDPCAFDTACAIENAICATNYQDGLCTVACNGACQTDPNKAAAYCTAFRESGFCLPICNPNASGACREGYTCTSVAGLGESKASEYVCSPTTTAN